jgi:tRNA threonylcarbamoyladenosine biosynthesis protein TsaB
MERFLILETSHQPGVVALAEGETILAERRLQESRRHARDLAPTTKSLLDERGWKPRAFSGVIVSLGPGSYTGLRVGLMSAKTLAYATGCALIGVETFRAIARLVIDASDVAVLADAQQGKVYVQHFQRGEPTDALAIRRFDDWLASCPSETCITGPGLETFANRLSGRPMAPRELWTPTAASLLALGYARFRNGERDDPFALEPLYLRPSSAEENWEKNRPRR